MLKNPFLGELTNIFYPPHLNRFCDIWSLGCTVIEMATGKAPWSNLAKNSGTAVSVELWQEDIYLKRINIVMV